MIKIDGSVKLSFLFPADCDTAFAYFGELRRVAAYMPHIELVRANGQGQYRMLFDTTEMGTYNIRIFYDVTLETDPEEYTLCVYPMPMDPPVERSSGFNVTSAPGSFYTEASFAADGSQTRVHFLMRLESEVLPPTSMRFVSGRMANKVARNITEKRLKEIAVGFVQNSLQAFPAWQEKALHRGTAHAAPPPPPGGLMTTTTQPS